MGGILTVTGGVTGDVASAFDIGDSDKLLLGTGDDLTLYHDGSNSFIRENADYKGERYTEEILTQDVLTQEGGFFDPYTKREVGNAYYMGGLSYSENEIKDRAKRNGIDWDNYGAREAWFEENNIKSPLLIIGDVALSLFITT